MIAGCGTIYVNKADRNPTYHTETDFDSNRNTEMTYRRIYTMLYTCTSGYYRVQGNFDPGSRHAEISVDTGVGFENDLYFADSHVMSIIIEADGVEEEQSSDQADEPPRRALRGRHGRLGERGQRRLRCWLIAWTGS